MKIDKNNPSAFVNDAVMEEDEECFANEDGKNAADLEQVKVRQNLLPNEQEKDGEVSDLGEDRWLKLTRQVRGAIAVKNAVAKPNKRRLSRRSTTNVDPFLQRFSTREIGVATSPPSRASLHSIDEEKQECVGKDGDVTTEDESHGSLDLLTYLRLTWGSCSPTGVIDPDGSFLYYWFYCLITAIRYNFWAIILRFAFTDAQEDYPTLWWVLDSISDIIYVLDILINCRVGFVEEGILVKDTNRTCRRYLQSYKFYLDLLSVLPLELLYFITGIQPILRFPRFLKVYKSQEVRNRLEGRANNPTVVRVFFLIHLMFVMIHWNAGIYFLICRAEGFGTNEWVYPALNGSQDTLTRKYVSSFYWSMLTLTTIGDLPSPVTDIEYLYTIGCYLAGVFVFAMIVGNAGSIILNRNASRLEFERQRDNAKSYMTIHNVPRELQRRVLKWYDYSWSRGRLSGEGGDLNSLHLLPDKMKTEIALHVHLETLRKVTFLQNCEPEFLHELLLKMKLHIFTPGDLIIRHGEIAREMYLITHGRIEVISETGKVLKELGTGDFFGEIGILSLSAGQNRRTADVRSIGYTECFVLSKDDVLSGIEQFPQAQMILAEYGRKRLQNTSGDPRLVKLDNNDPMQNEATSPGEKSHVVDIEKSEKNVEDINKNKVKSEGTGKGLSKDHARAISSLFKARRNLAASNAAKQNSGGAKVEEEATRNTRYTDDRQNNDETCSNTLDNLKVILQNAIEKDFKKHEDFVSRLQYELKKEKEKLHQAQQEMETQKDKIEELEEMNRTLELKITDRDIKIFEWECALQRESKEKSLENISPRPPQTNEVAVLQECTTSSSDSPPTEITSTVQESRC